MRGKPCRITSKRTQKKVLCKNRSVPALWAPGQTLGFAVKALCSQLISVWLIHDEEKKHSHSSELPWSQTWQPLGPRFYNKTVYDHKECSLDKLIVLDLYQEKQSEPGVAHQEQDTQNGITANTLKISRKFGSFTNKGLVFAHTLSYIL